MSDSRRLGATRWRLRLCAGGRKSSTVVVDPTQTAIDRIEAELRDKLGIREDNILRCHFDYEACYVGRTLSELLRWPVEQFDEHIIHLHSRSPFKGGPPPFAPTTSVVRGRPRSVLQHHQQNITDADSDESGDDASHAGSDLVEGLPSTSSEEVTYHTVILEVQRHDPWDEGWYGYEPGKIRFDFPASDGFDALHHEVRSQLIADLQPNVRVQEAWTTTHRQLRFELGVHINAYARGEVKLNDPFYGGRFCTLRDILVRPRAVHKVLTVYVYAELTKPNVSASERRASKHGEVHPIVEDLIPLRVPEELPVYRRVGNWASATYDADCVPYARPLIAVVDRNERVTLRKGDAWVLGDHVIGSLHDTQPFENTARQCKSCEWAPGFDDVVQEGKVVMSKLLQRIQQEPEGQHPLEKLPSLPPLWFAYLDAGNTVVPGGAHLGTENDEEGKTRPVPMVAAVRFFNHLQKANGRRLKFDDNCQIEINDGDTFAQALIAVTESVTRMDGKEFNAARCLIDRNWNEPCHFELFAMPQPPGERKLFRLPTKGDESSRAMTEFLSQGEVDKGNKMIYMEAHVWPGADLMDELDI